MSVDDGFLRWRRGAVPKRAVADRLGDSHEVLRPQDSAITEQQAGRCMDCGIPFCHQGCPLGNEIPDFNDLVFTGRWREAHERLAMTNNFPEFTGRLCPAPCEAACTLAINDDPVTIEQIELEIAERAFREGWLQPAPPAHSTGRTVAIVGSGPAGLAAAAQLNAAGHQVTVYEAADRIGGLLRYGIPDFKLDKAVIDRRLTLLVDEGVRFVTGARVGHAPRWDTLAGEHDAVLIAVGSGRPRDLDVPGRGLRGVHFAMTYLEHQNRRVAGDPVDDPDLDAAGKRVVILGGGDTGSDCLGTALRQGAAHVAQIELLQRPPEPSSIGNPEWPRWPLVFRTSSSQEEGGERSFAVLTTALDGSDGRVTALRSVQVQVGAQRRLVPVPGSEHVQAVDLVLLAMGFLGPDSAQLVKQLGVTLDARGNVATDERYATTVPGVYAAGDARRGQSLIVWAISEGREAARAIDADLRGTQTSDLPSRGADSPFV